MMRVLHGQVSDCAPRQVFLNSPVLALADSMSVLSQSSTLRWEVA